MGIPLISQHIVFVILAVYCHRTILMDSFRGESGPRFFFTPRERTFFLWSIVLYVVVSLLLAIAVSAGSVLVASLVNKEVSGKFLESMLKTPLMIRVLIEGFAFLFCYFFGRWSLIFPAIAVDGDPSLGWSWKQTKGNGCRLGFLVWVFPLMVSITGELITSYWSGTALWSSFLVGFWFSFAWFFITPLEVAVISIAFRALTNWNAVRQEVSVQGKPQSVP
ncbi:MAG: hypothetical protein AB7T38_03735 [Nitrospirales bacterium]